MGQCSASFQYERKVSFFQTIDIVNAKLTPIFTKALRPVGNHTTGNVCRDIDHYASGC
jgi:hypothetical protein